MTFNRQQVEDMRRKRQDAAERAAAARSRGLTTLAEGFDRIVAQWDILLTHHGANRGGQPPAW